MTAHQPAPGLPAHAPKFAQPARTSDTLVFVCTYNESGSIATMLDRLLALKARCDIVVIDDNSPDGTLDIVARRAAEEPRVGALVRPRKLGLGSAHKLGWAHARRMGYTRIATLDADLSHDPADVQRLLDQLDAGADVAIGSRFLPGARLDYRGIRRFVSQTANVLASMFLRMGLTEHTTSLRAARLDRVPVGLIESIKNDGYSFQVACIARLVRAGLTIKEIPIHFRDRHHGQSKISKREAVYGMINLLSLAFDRRPSVVLPEPSSLECPVCARPYMVRRHSGELRCLACFGSIEPS